MPGGGELRSLHFFAEGRLLTFIEPSYSAIGFVLILCFVPETKALSLEELDQVFSVPTKKHAAYQVSFLGARFCSGPSALHASQPLTSFIFCYHTASSSALLHQEAHSPQECESADAR